MLIRLDMKDSPDKTIRSTKITYPITTANLHLPFCVLRKSRIGPMKQIIGVVVLPKICTIIAIFGTKSSNSRQTPTRAKVSQRLPHFPISLPFQSSCFTLYLPTRNRTVLVMSSMVT